MASSIYKQSISSGEIVTLLEANESVSDFSDDSEDSEPDFTGNQSISDSEIEGDGNNEVTKQLGWQTVNESYVPNKFPFSGVYGPKRSATSPLESFLLFFDSDILELIVSETNRYAEQKIQGQNWKPRSRVNSWIPVDKEEIYV